MTGRGGSSRSRRWVVRADDPRVLGAALERWGVGRDAALQGRVFVDSKRVGPDAALRPGAQVEVHPARVTSRAADVVVLARREDVIAVLKPAGIPTIPAQHGVDDSVLAAVATILGIGDPSRVHTSSRLDADVSGVLLVATTPVARAALARAREEGAYQRHYVAITAAIPAVRQGAIDAPIGRAPDRKARRVAGADAVPCLTRYAVVATAGGRALAAAEPVTGRTHQIRVHLAHLGAPIVGDGVYGARRTVSFPSGAVRDIGRIALHAAWVSVRLGPGRAPWTVHAPVPPELQALWRELGGSDSVWGLALAPIAPEAQGPKRVP